MSELSDKLKKLDITFKSVHVAFIEDENWPHDLWRCTIKYKSSVYVCDNYKTGIGHRRLDLFVKKEFTNYGSKRYWNKYIGKYLTEQEAAKAGWLKPTAPSVADVIHSLLSDASGADNTFEDWCSDFGYDSDSRKALDIYLKCQKNLLEMRKLFGCELFNELVQLEH